MNILIVGGSGGYKNPFLQLGNIIEDDDAFLKDPENFDLLVFTGGEDVCPAMYGHTSPKHFCAYNVKRDIYEQQFYELALSKNIPMTGICRGSQFLNVMAGGTLMHHITNHGSSHTIETIDGDIMEVTSTHHQMCLPAKNGHIVAWSSNKRSTVYYGDKDEKVDYTGKEVEGVYYPDKNIFAVQFHPEYMKPKSPGFLWYREGVYNLLHLSKEEFVKRYFTTKVQASA